MPNRGCPLFFCLCFGSIIISLLNYFCIIRLLGDRWSIMDDGVNKSFVQTSPASLLPTWFNNLTMLTWKIPAFRLAPSPEYHTINTSYQRSTAACKMSHRAINYLCVSNFSYKTPAQYRCPYPSRLSFFCCWYRIRPNIYFPAEQPTFVCSQYIN